MGPSTPGAARTDPPGGGATRGLADGAAAAAAIVDGADRFEVSTEIGPDHGGENG